MKIYLDCECLLLSCALKSFLKPFLVDENEADFIVSDHTNFSVKKPIFIIGKDLALPFTKNELLKALNDFSHLNTLEKSLDELLNKFKNDLINIIKYAK